MIVLYQILAFSIVLGIIVLVHEFGHYIAARLMGVRVEAFSFGFGKRIIGKKLGETDFRLSVIPLGGYVKMAGEEEYDPKNLKPYEFHAKNRAQKIFILGMGPLMNLLLAFLILTIINIGGVEMEKYRLEPPEIGYVKPDSTAARAGLQPGDLILSVNGRTIADWKGLQVTIGANPDETLAVEYKRGGSIRQAKLEVKGISQYNLGYAGLYWAHKTEVESVDPGSPAAEGGLQKGDVIMAVFDRPVTVYEIHEVISGSQDKPLRFRIRRDNRERDIVVTPRKIQDEVKIGIGMLAYSPTVVASYGLFEAMGKSSGELVNLTFLTFNAFKKLLVGKLSPKNLSGPIEIAKFSQRAMEQGFSSFFMLIAFISLQLGLINLFPIPALDGGHLMIYSIEAVIRHEFSQKTKAILINTGFLLLIGLMVFVILNDVAKVLPNGWKSLLPF